MAEPTQPTNGTTTPEQSMLILNLGTRSRKNIRRLRRGRGKLMRRVADTINDLKAEDEIAENAQVVVVVVKQRPNRNNWFRW